VNSQQVGLKSGNRVSSTGPRWKGFRLETLRRFGIEVDGDRVEVPYRTLSGNHYRTKVFTAEGQRWLGATMRLIPYGLETLADRDENPAGRTLYLTEGESDALALRITFPASSVLGIPGASSWKPEWARVAEGFERIYLCFDADRAGRRLHDAVRADIPDCRSILLPDGADTRDILQSLGRSAFNVLIDVADCGYEQQQAWHRTDEACQRRNEVVRAWEERA
jgi:5S rRNA maturation endonuclease (ribonuclease M5)